MNICVIQASSQRARNGLLYESTKIAARAFGHEVENLGCREGDRDEYTYVETALSVGLLINSGAADFVVTGCSSGQGMMLACNALPGILCGYLENPQDAYLFGRINGGNVASLPLGLNFGWCGEINMQVTLDKLFEGPFGEGYPLGDAGRKKHDALLVKEINAISKADMTEVLKRLDKDLVKKVLCRKPVMDYIRAYAKETELTAFLMGNAAAFVKK